MPLPQITLKGRAVDALELRFTPAGKAVASVRVAASESKKNDRGGYDDGDRIFANVSLWEADAEAAAEAGIEKGDPVLVSGVLFEREYETREGNKGKSLEVKFATIAKIPPRQKQQGQSQPRQQPAADPWSTPTTSKPDPWGAPSVSSDEPPF